MGYEKSVVVAGVLVSASVASANLIVNGGFDLAVPQNGTGNGWTGFDNDSLGGWYGSNGNPGGRYVMNDNGDVATDPGVEQVVSGLGIGQTYRLSGDYASAIRSVFAGPPGFAVDVDGMTVFEAGATGVNDWTAFSVDFVAGGSDVTITFRAEANGTDNDFQIDNIDLVLVPTPGAAGVLAVAGGVVLRRRR
jgi:hypothetical protein